MSSITVNGYPQTTSDKVLTLTGTNDSLITSLYITGVTASISSQTPTSWTASVQLGAGKNQISIYGLDDAMNTTANVELTIVRDAIDQEVHQVFNHFSEHGIPRALPQIIGEKNYFYRHRLLEVFKRPTNTTLPGVHFGINRELSLQYFPGFKIRAVSYADGTLGANNAAAWIDSCVLVIECDEMVEKDALCYVEAATDTFYLNQYPVFDDGFKVVDLQGRVVPNTDYEVTRVDKSVRMLSPKYRDQRLRVSYRYHYITNLFDKNLSELAAELESITFNGKQAFDCAYRTSYWESKGLFSGQYPIAIGRGYGTFWWSRLRVRELHNYWFFQYMLNSHGGAYDTKLEKWAAETNSRTAILWKDTKLDKHYWNIIPEDRQTFGALPHLFDSFVGHWACADPTCTARYTMIDYLRYGGVCPSDSTPLTYKGVSPLHFQNGTGTGNDLRSIVTGFDS